MRHLTWGLVLFATMTTAALAAPPAGTPPPVAPNNGMMQGNTIVVDSRPLHDLHVMRIGADDYFPLQAISDRLRLGIRVSADGTITMGSTTFHADVHTLDGVMYVSRDGVKKALNASVYVDTSLGRAVITTRMGQAIVVKQSTQGQTSGPNGMPPPNGQSPPPRYGNGPTPSGPPNVGFGPRSGGATPAPPNGGYAPNGGGPTPGSGAPPNGGYAPNGAGPTPGSGAPPNGGYAPNGGGPTPASGAPPNGGYSPNGGAPTGNPNGRPSPSPSSGYPGNGTYPGSGTYPGQSDSSYPAGGGSPNGPAGTPPAGGTPPTGGAPSSGGARPGGGAPVGPNAGINTGYNNGGILSAPSGGTAAASQPTSRQHAKPQGGSLSLYSITLDRSVAHNNMLRVQGTVYNATLKPLDNLTVTFVLWTDGTREANDALTGEPIGQGAAYSEYPKAIGTLAPGESRTFEIMTSVANPDKMDFSGRTIELNVSNSTDPFAVRRLRYGFKASVGSTH